MITQQTAQDKKSLVGYKLTINNMDAKTCTAEITKLGMNGFYISNKKDGVYLVDAVNFLEEAGVDPFELEVGVENMVKMDHDTAHFGMMGTFIFSSFEGVKQ